ncbi:hypothetical protein GPECTOR_1136g408 [Gonium pectorale]|uniref:Uncharacterized protein n=1 Tax=Gonium pectorale TaxID=33097 RepID=A0A150FTM8_GONPE|nr:hypothetical protein GPECTOR_1136g408 [Gonium pectorale]|eukprot:KXZ40959.1 hypothetical protein GPECTOR_1136g408 [Gonium pectorale]
MITRFNREREHIVNLVTSPAGAANAQALKAACEGPADKALQQLSAYAAGAVATFVGLAAKLGGMLLDMGPAMAVVDWFAGSGSAGANTAQRAWVSTAAQTINEAEVIRPPFQPEQWRQGMGPFFASLRRLRDLLQQAEQQLAQLANTELYKAAFRGQRSAADTSSARGRAGAAAATGGSGAAVPRPAGGQTGRRAEGGEGGARAGLRPPGVLEQVLEAVNAELVRDRRPPLTRDGLFGAVRALRDPAVCVNHSLLGQPCRPPRGGACPWEHSSAGTLASRVLSYVRAQVNSQ